MGGVGFYRLLWAPSTAKRVDAKVDNSLMHSANTHKPDSWKYPQMPALLHPEPENLMGGHALVLTHICYLRVPSKSISQIVTQLKGQYQGSF